MDQQTPAHLSPPNASARQRLGAGLAIGSLCLAIAAPIGVVLAWNVAGSGTNCTFPTPPPTYNSYVQLSIVLYFGALVACGLAVIGGGWALRSARREPLAWGYRAVASIAMALGILVGVASLCYSPIFYYAYQGGLYGFCPEI